MSNPEAHIGGPAGGVPKKIFRPGFEGTVPGVSGKTSLAYVFERDKLEIKDAADESLHFRMTYWPREEAVGMSIRTKSSDSERHPDLYAAKLVEHGIAYIEEQGFPVKKIRGEWKPHSNSDPYKQYDSALKQLIAESGEGKITGELMRQAAKKPWTAEVARSLGYDELQSFEPRDTGEIVAFFGKSQE